MINIIEYKKKVSEFSTKELIKEKNRLVGAIEFLERNNEFVNEKNRDIYLEEIECLIECLRLLKIKSVNETPKSIQDKKEMHDGDKVFIGDKIYTISIVADKKNFVQKNNNIIEVHVLLKFVEDYEYIRRVYDRYKKDIKQ